MVITSLYAGLLGLFFLVLSVHVIRKRTKVSLGDGGDTELLRRIRAHGNFAEYTPLVLILMAMAELGQAGPPWLLHLTGLALLLGRLLHGIALGFTRQWVLGRVGGMVLTFAALTVAALLCLWQGLSALG